MTAQLGLEQGGGLGKVCVIDTENSFRPENIGPIAERYQLVPEDVLENIVYTKAFTSDSQMQIIEQLGALFSTERYSVLIIDSIMALFRTEYTGRGMLAERQQNLSRMLGRLKKVAEEYNIAVVMTNQVQSDPSGQMFVADPKKHVGGHVLAHASTVRLMTRNGRAGTKVLKVEQHPSMPQNDAGFSITEQGVADADV